MNPAPPPPVTVPVRRLRATLRSVLLAVEQGRDHIVLTRHGRPVAVLVPVEAVAALDGPPPVARPAPPDRASTPAPSEGPHGCEA